MGRWSLLLGMGAAVLAASAHAQDADVAPAATSKPVLAAAPARVADSNVEPFYRNHPGVLIWLRDADSRAAAAELAGLLKSSAIDGFAKGPLLGAGVEQALARGLPADDAVISNAWVRYVQVLKSPVNGISFGDPALQLNPPSADAILRASLAAPSLTRHVEAVTSVNPFYASLRKDALAAGKQDDPHVRATLDRLRLIPAKGKAIVVDAANAQLMMIEDGAVLDSMKVIVGKPDFATPLLASTIWYVTLNPYWHIPQDVAKRKVAPIVLKRGVGYLKAARYQTVAAFGGDKEQPIDPSSIDWKAVAAGTVEAHIRQLSGPANMMGKVKFGFANDYGIFLHDTPHKNLFANDRRNLSLGCVRLEHPERLAKWLLGRDPEPESDDSEQNVQLDKGIPVYITYMSARPDGDSVAFADDVYKLDTSANGEALAAAGQSASK